jgi:hypothetical protein
VKRILLLAAAAALLATWGWTDNAWATGRGTLKNRVAYRQSQTYPWHGAYYDAAWGTPVAMVAPPTAENQTHLGWGVGATRVNSIQHQFQRNYPGGGYTSVRPWFRPAPAWPSSTDQLGAYYVRGPW